MRKSNDPTYRQLADITISLDNDWDGVKTDELVETKVIKAGTHAYAAINEDLTNDYKYMEEKYKVHWYRGADTILSENPYYNWLSKGSSTIKVEKNKAICLFDTVKSFCHFKT